MTENALIRLHNASQITLAATVLYAGGNAVSLSGWMFRWVLVAASSPDAVVAPARPHRPTGHGP